jgi:hypothetical protein
MQLVSRDAQKRQRPNTHSQRLSWQARALNMTTRLSFVIKAYMAGPQGGESLKCQF